ncbi:Possible glycosyl transferase [Mycobacteroides abscessus]|nr:Possible glycosyl transferase [Mycobacteroides abscessus]
MRILMVSWEYPPVVIGGLGRHVHHLSTELAAAGHDVVVLTRRPSGTDPSSHPTSDEISEGVRVVAAAEDPHDFDFGTDMMAWTLAMGHAMVRAGLALGLKGSGDWRPDVVHAHDWLAPTPLSRWPNISMSRWCPRCTPPRPAATAAGCLGASAGRCTRWNGGWLANRTR